jgi:NAD(P)-dependent dehydrogenase (short-subunit alcohol dehydrogenase family)
MELKNLRVVVTGGSRGLGLGVVEGLVAREARVTVVARGEAGLAALRARLAVETIAADITDAAAAGRILHDVQPSVLILNAGAAPPMGSLDSIRWDEFTTAWETDVKGGFHWMQAALNQPLAVGARVLVSSSGAAQNGSPLSGGYAGAKRMLWLMANYANSVSTRRSLGIRFQTLVPMQMVAGTGVGDAGAGAYGAQAGLEPAQFLTRYGAPLTPRRFGDHVMEILTDTRYEAAAALGMTGKAGITVLEDRAA